MVLRLDALVAKLPDQELMWHQVWCVELGTVDVDVELWQLALLFSLRTHTRRETRHGCMACME